MYYRNTLAVPLTKDSYRLRRESNFGNHHYNAFSVGNNLVYRFHYYLGLTASRYSVKKRRTGSVIKIEPLDSIVRNVLRTAQDYR